MSERVKTVELKSTPNAMASLTQGCGKCPSHEGAGEDVPQCVYGIPLFSGMACACRRYSLLGEILQGYPLTI